MPTTLRVQVAVQGKLGLPKQQFMNTFHFVVPAADIPAEAASVAEVVEDFYLESANSIDTPYVFFSNAVATDDHRIAVYNLGDPEPRVPVLETLWDLGGAASVEGYPSEVALVCSFSGAVVSGANMARRRGRIFFGPLKNTCGDLDGNVIRPTAAFMNCMVANMEKLKDDIDALGAGFDWVVYSPTANTAVPVTHGWVDNAFDTQRRRGEDATTRIVWP